MLAEIWFRRSMQINMTIGVLDEKFARNDVDAVWGVIAKEVNELLGKMGSKEVRRNSGGWLGRVGGQCLRPPNFPARSPP